MSLKSNRAESELTRPSSQSHVELSGHGDERRPGMLDRRGHAVLRGPRVDVLTIDIALENLERAAVVQPSLLPFDLPVGSGPLETPRRIEDQKSPIGIEHHCQVLEQAPLLIVRKMTDQEADQR